MNNLRGRFNRTYVRINPDPFLGPYTWRLSNIPSTDFDTIGAIEDIYAVLPIDKTETNNIVNLFFNIADLPDVYSGAAYMPDFDELFSGPRSPRESAFGIDQLASEAPIKTTVNREYDIGVIWFDLTDLPNLMTLPTRSNRKFKLTQASFRYNNRSVDSLTASAPLFAQTDGDKATVTFDYRTLPEA